MAIAMQWLDLGSVGRGLVAAAIDRLLFDHAQAMLQQALHDAMTAAAAAHFFAWPLHGALAESSPSSPGGDW